MGKILKQETRTKDCIVCFKPGWIGRKYGRRHISGSIGLLPAQSNTPSTCHFSASINQIEHEKINMSRKTK